MFYPSRDAIENAHEKIALTCFLLMSFPAYCGVTVEVYCFSGGEQGSTKNNIHFELRTYYDNDAKWDAGGFVKYKGHKPIPVIFNYSEDDGTREDDGIHPMPTTTNWIEFSKGKVTGEYEMDSQGAM